MNILLYGAYVPFLGSEVDISHDHSDFGAQIQCLSSEGLFSPFSLNSIYFLHIYKIPDRWIYDTIILILGPQG
jgi:hypothetical protein